MAFRRKLGHTGGKVVQGGRLYWPIVAQIAPILAPSAASPQPSIPEPTFFPSHPLHLALFRPRMVVSLPALFESLILVYFCVPCKLCVHQR